MNQKGFAVLRIAFGLVWLIDAFFKWQPDFVNNFSNYLTGGLEGQPLLVQQWINLWIKVVGVNPHLFAIATAIVETIIAVGLIFGILTRYIIFLGTAFAFVIWSTAESFGGPYKPGSTDIGAAVIYIFVFAALLLGRCWEMFSLDQLFFKAKLNCQNNIEYQYGKTKS